MDATPAVSPWKLWPSPTISKRPVASLARRIATSFDSDPVLSTMTLSSGAGSRSARRSARRMTSSESIQLLRWRTRSHASRMASTMRGWLWPIVLQIWPLVKSRMRLPARSQTQLPCARCTMNGANPGT